MRSTTTVPSKTEVAAIYRTPVLDLIGRAAEVHRQHHDPSEVQVCVLLSVKTGGCPEDCGYCPQAARYHTGVEAHALLDVADVLSSARRARDDGASRFCMGAAWREVRDNAQFDQVLEMVRGVKALGLEACCTLGMLTESQAERLKEAGLDAYNHNLDTSEAFYDRVISTRTYAGPPANASACARRRDHGLLRWNRRYGGDRGRPNRAAAHAGEPSRAPRVGSDPCAGGRGGDTSGDPAQGRDLGHAAYHRDREDPHASRHGPAVRGADRDERG